MARWREFWEKYPILSMWAILAVGMVLIFLWASRDVELTATQRLFLALSCVGLAGICSWIISWE
ncbi:MAG: hypothetical protein H5T64_07630 [Chloroflexi bacterium]|nr:hypothetical protein [Chloroflexota bacterium]